MASDRIEWLDFLRGVSVGFVILYHASVVAFVTEGFGTTAASFVNGAAAPFRMPAMAFLSGLLVPRSLRKGNRRFVGGKLRRIAHPYVLWSFIMIALWTGPLGLVEFRPAMVLDIAREPFDHLWYLYLLLGCYLLALATQRIRPLFLVIAATAGLVIPVGLSGQHLSFVYLTAFFMMGVEVATHPDQWSTWFSSRGASVLAVACGAAALLTPWWLPGSTEVSVALIPLMSVVLVGTWSLLSSGRFRVSSPVVEGLGRNSMVYYVCLLYTSPSPRD